MAKKIDINREEFIKLRKQGLSLSEIANEMNVGNRTIERFNVNLKKELSQDEIQLIEENIKLAKAKLRLQDKNRIDNKQFRDLARIENAIVELDTELLKILKTHKFPKSTFKRKRTKPSKKTGAILQLSDLHFNELVELVHNRYDFSVASQRIKKLIDDARVYLQAKNVKDVVVAFTGDLLNSDRRPDEYLSQATNRASALFLSVAILRLAIADLAQDFNVTVVSVIGNESRMTKEVGWVEAVANDNYDYVIHNILRLIFEASNSPVQFFMKNSTEQVIEIVGQNILAIHGHQISGSKMEKGIQQIIGKYASEKILIDFVISGHLHSARGSDMFARSSSLVGSNAYSRDALQLASRASQNLHIFYDDGNHDSVIVGLQNADDVEGYPIVKELEAYNAKSAKKACRKTIVTKIVI